MPGSPDPTDSAMPMAAAPLRVTAVRTSSGVSRYLRHPRFRCVFTMVGSPAAIEAAVLLLAKVAVERIDMTRHTGQHPRILYQFRHFNFLPGLSGPPCFH